MDQRAHIHPVTLLNDDNIDKLTERKNKHGIISRNDNINLLSHNTFQPANTLKTTLARMDLKQ